jgi:hypothetical protein
MNFVTFFVIFVIFVIFVLPLIRLQTRHHMRLTFGFVCNVHERYLWNNTRS